MRYQTVFSFAILAAVPRIGRADVLPNPQALDLFDTDLPVEDPDATALRLPARPSEEPREPPVSHHHDEAHWRLAGALGVGFGSFQVNSAGVGTVTQGHLDGGMRRDRLLIYVGYDLMSLAVPGGEVARGGMTEVASSRGLLHRLGGNVRYGFGRAGCSDVGVELWTEAGVGVQHFRWDAGGAWTRPDVALGIGGSFWALNDTQHGGLSVGLRVTLAGRDTAGAPKLCGGPCDAATGPTRLDRSFLFDMRLMFGK